MTVVGAVTGNKDLMKIGGVMGLVGGIGGLVAGAGDVAAGAAADAAGNVAQEGFRASEIGAENAAGIGSDVATAGADTVASAAGQAPIAAVDTAPAVTGANAQPIAQPDSLTQGVQQPAVTPTQQTPIAQSGPSQGAQAPGGAAVNNPMTAPDLGPKGTYTPFEDNFVGTNAITPGGAPSSSSSFFDRLTNFATSNQKLLAGGMQMLGGAMNGANQRDMWNQQMALKQKQMDIANSVGSITPRPTGLIQGATV
jgi:hypothetical protein